MPDYDLFQVDAFASEPFTGNPAAVMPVASADQDWPADTLLQAIALENNLSETAFLRKKSAGAYDLRWFTPAQEVPLCGHATLASAHALWTECDETADKIVFATKSGALSVAKTGDGYEMSFPADEVRHIQAPEGLSEALGAQPLDVLQGQYLLAVFEGAAQVTALKPDMGKLQALAEKYGALTACVVATAPGGDDRAGAPMDFVSRFFAPAQGIPEDPVTGSAHCMLAPFWSERLKRNTLRAFQASQRGGRVDCRLSGDRVFLSGEAVTILRGRMRF